MKSIQICGDDRMKKVRLEDVSERGSSNLAQKDIEGMTGAYPIYGASGYIGNIDFYHQEKEYIAVVKDGAGVGRAMFLPEKSSVIGTLQYIIPKKNILPKYLYYAVKNMKLARYYTGATIPHIYYKDYKKETFWLPDIHEQQKEVCILEKVEDIMEKQQQSLADLDTLIKSRFVEMFGNPVTNSSELKMLPMTSVCEIIDGDRGENYPKAEDFSEEGDCLFLNTKNVTASGFNFDTCMYITKEKDESLRKGKLKRGDVVLTTRGTLGNLAYYTDKIPYDNIRINSGMVILRMKREVIDEIYFIEHFKFQLDDIKSKIASGSAQPQLPISTMNKIQIIIPEIGKQKEFAAFVHQVDKLKLTTQKSLKKLEILKKSLMQEYFG